MSRAKSIRALESEVECLSAEVARLRLMVERCESMRNFPESTAVTSQQPIAAPHMVLPLAGQPLDVLPSIFSGAEGTTRLLKVLLETYPWLLPTAAAAAASTSGAAATAHHHPSPAAASMTPTPASHQLHPASSSAPQQQPQQRVTAAAGQSAPAVQQASVSAATTGTAGSKPKQLDPPQLARLDTAQPSEEQVSPQLVSRQPTAFTDVADSPTAAVAPLAQYRPKPQENRNFRTAMTAQRNDWANETDELDF